MLLGLDVGLIDTIKRRTLPSYYIFDKILKPSAPSFKPKKTYICSMDSKRQSKVSRLLQRELADILQFESRGRFGGSMITVTKVNVTRDLAIARVYLSLFATNDKEKLLDDIKQHSREFRGKLGRRVKNQLRSVPELEFYLDDSLDYIENIEQLLDE